MVTTYSTPSCRVCGSPLQHSLVDLGASPLAESYLTAECAQKGELFYPLHPKICENCFLVQLEVYASPREIFSEYAYLSSCSDSWLAHAAAFVQFAVDRLNITAQSRVLEIASNDGYLLQYFQQRGIPILGIEPAANIARVASTKGIPTLVAFFGSNTAEKIVFEHGHFDLVIANNVIAQVPDLHDFVAGIKIVLADQGTLTFEFPHLMQLLREIQFDTIYHEHFSYFSLFPCERLLQCHRLRVFDVEKLPTHGGSLRIYVCHCDDQRAELPSVATLREEESANGITRIDTYKDFSPKVEALKRRMLRFLIDAKDHNKTIVGYGAPAKGNTLLNYCGIRGDLLDYTVDRNPYKQGKYLPGTHIPIFPPGKIAETKPDYVLILPWNLKEEIMAQLAFIREWGGQFVLSIPNVEVH